ncbi:DUF7127 family protein [Halobaculum marinum]|uniref:Hsp20/alpha crystallin family protein n=1 Tax=Halobaculum marinum TaxID=3031996 RepID=A0ABD5X2I2_9EURY|nr:Hsp20/alpha crystallin family protein [Halobaculum sp. DT55]
MTQRHTTDRRERFVRRYDYEDGTVVAADLDAADDDVHVDTLDGSAIVVIDRGDGEEEFEFALPGPAASVDIENGVLTIRIS